jgi:hypothetical protein
MIKIKNATSFMIANYSATNKVRLFIITYEWWRANLFLPFAIWPSHFFPNSPILSSSLGHMPQLSSFLSQNISFFLSSAFFTPAIDFHGRRMRRKNMDGEEI